jgi:hypothetical protein
LHEDAAGKMALEVDDLGTPALKNIAVRVQVFRVRPAAERAAPTLPDRLSIAVLPFQNMSGDPEQEYFADGIVEEIITGLPRIPSLRVIARNSSFARLMCDRSARNWALATFWRAACARPRDGCGSPASSSTPTPARISGGTGSTAI